MEKKNYLKIGLVFVTMFVLATLINMYNGYPFKAFFFATLLSTVIYTVIVVGSLYLMKKLSMLVKVPLTYVISFVLVALLNIMQGYSYDMYIKSVVWGTMIFVTLGVGLYYLYKVEE